MTQSRVARKAHACSGCSAPIVAGSTYTDERRVSSPGIAFRWHASCLAPQAPMSDAEFDAARDAVEAGWDGHKAWR